MTGFPEPPSEPTPKRRGRRTELTDSQLQNRREQLVQVFEGFWGEIGRGLEKCKKADDLISVLTPLSETFVGDMIAVFCRPSEEEPSGSRLRKLRVRYHSLVQPHYYADAAKRAAEERLQQVNWAITFARKGEIRRVRRERKKRRKQFAAAERVWRTSLTTQRGMELRLRSLEASFARHELFRFLKSHRYSLNPLSLANAAAGLPHMGWRQSLRRTITARSRVADGVNYRSFKAVRYLVETAKRKTVVALLDRFREGIPTLPRRFGDARDQLADDWMFIEGAIRQTCRGKPHPKDLPFEIVKRYLKRKSQGRSQVDMVLAQQARLHLSKAPRKRG